MRETIEWSLYAIVDLSVTPPDRAPEAAAAAARGGATVIQLRGKDVGGGQMLTTAEAVGARLEPLQVPLVVNDRIDVAVLAGVAGVHLGDDDLEVAAARRLAPGMSVGRTVRTPAAARAAVAAGADYLGAGAVFGSRTKPGAPCIGPAGLAAVCRAVAAPVVAIGGIDAGGAATCAAAGAAGIAVIGALFAGDPDAAEIEARARRLRAAFAAAGAGRIS